MRSGVVSGTPDSQSHLLSHFPFDRAWDCRPSPDNPSLKTPRHQIFPHHTLRGTKGRTPPSLKRLSLHLLPIVRNPGLRPRGHGSVSHPATPGVKDGLPTPLPLPVGPRGWTDRDAFFCGGLGYRGRGKKEREWSPDSVRRGTPTGILERVQWKVGFRVWVGSGLGQR